MFPVVRVVVVVPDVDENVRIYDLHWKLLCSCHVENACDVTVLNDEMVAVTQGKLEQIQLLEMQTSGASPKIMISRVIKTNGACYGIAFNGEHTAVAIERFSSKASIQMVAQYGRVRQVIWMPESVGAPRSLIADTNSNDDDMFLFVDKSKAYCVYRNGKVVLLQENVTSFNATIDGNGNMCCFENDHADGRRKEGAPEVLRVNVGNGQVSKVMMNSELTNPPHGIWYNKYSGTFVVTNANSGVSRTKLAQYRLSYNFSIW